MKPEGKKLLVRLLLNSVILITLYFLIPSLFPFYYMPHIYLLAGAFLGLYYVIYNRGFVAKNASPDELPAHLSPVQKQAFIEDGQRRFKNSKWVLTLLIPIILTFFADVVYLYLFPYFEEFFA